MTTKKHSAFLLSFPHFLAMHAPHRKLRAFFYRLRGTKIGKNTFIAPNVFIEEGRPEMVTIEDNVRIGPGVIIAVHDTAYHAIYEEKPVIWNEVKIGKGSYIGAGAIILPGITIGKKAIVAAGAVVTENVPDYTMVAGIPARKIKNLRN